MAQYEAGRRLEVGPWVRGRPPLTSSVAQAGPGLSRLSFPPAWTKGHLHGPRPGESWTGRRGGGNSRCAGGVSPRSGSPGSRSHAPGLAEARGPETRSPRGAAEARPTGHHPRASARWAARRRERAQRAPGGGGPARAWLAATWQDSPCARTAKPREPPSPGELLIGDPRFRAHPRPLASGSSAPTH